MNLPKTYRFDYTFEYIKQLTDHHKKFSLFGDWKKEENRMENHINITQVSHNDDLVIRLEKEDEYREVENLVRDSFWNVYRPGCLEHYVLNQLRKDSAFVPELDFVIELNGKVVPLEIKSGKDYKRHSALCNVLADENYGIEYAYVFSEGNVEVSGKKVYFPIYMTMFLENEKMADTVYKLDLSGLTFDKDT